MPFTAAHAIVALPIAGRRSRRVPELLGVWMLSAFVVAAMIPDAPLFLNVVWPGADELAVGTHRWGLGLLVDLALAIMCTALWVLVIRTSWLAALPRRVPPVAPVGDARDEPRVEPLGLLGGVVAVSVSALLGLLTHLLWDDVTHLRGGAVQAWSFLREPIAGTALYKYIQHGSSAIGVLLLVGAAVVWWRRARSVEYVHLLSLVLTLLAGVALGMVGAVLRIQHDGGRVGLYSVARLAATYPVLGAAVALVLWAVVRAVIARRTRGSFSQGAVQD